MKDDRILKPRLRNCPFCGAYGAPEIRVSGSAAFVRCLACKAEGPWFDVSDYLPGDFHELSGEEQDRSWEDAKISAQHKAIIAWNGRPWEGAYFPEELEDLDRKMKLESGALYGASCSEEAAPCGD